MNRRRFLRIAGSAMAASGLASTRVESSPTSDSVPEIASSASASIRVQDNTIHIDTSTQSAVMVKGVLTSLKSKITDEIFIRDVDVTACPPDSFFTILTPR